jgi:hypothetical protein
MSFFVVREIICENLCAKGIKGISNRENVSVMSKLLDRWFSQEILLVWSNFM